MNILLISLECAHSRFSLEYLMKFLGIIEGFPPPLLLNISSSLPRVWNKKMIDLNSTKLKDEDIIWADFVFITAKLTQAKSARNILERCNTLNAKTLVCGSLFTSNDKYYRTINHLVNNEAEITIPQFLIDLKEGNSKQIYPSKTYSIITSAY